MSHPTENRSLLVGKRTVIPWDTTDKSILIEQLRSTQTQLGGWIESASVDRGFHTPENQVDLAKIVAHPCLPKPGAKQAAAQAAAATVAFRTARQRHEGAESAISGWQAGNGLRRCCDRTEVRFERYDALGTLGRNLHVLGKLLMAREHVQNAAAHPHRETAA